MASCIIILGAWVRGVPYITLTRMVVNLGLDVIIGAIPLLGDAFDIAWKANRRNYALLVRLPGAASTANLAGLGFSAADGCGAFWLPLPRAAAHDSMGSGMASRPRLRGAGECSRRDLRYNLWSRGVAQLASASALGAEGRGFEVHSAPTNKSRSDLETWVTERT